MAPAAEAIREQSAVRPVAAFDRIDDTGFYGTDEFMVEYGPDGALKELFIDYFRDVDPGHIVGFGIVEQQHLPGDSVAVLYRTYPGETKLHYQLALPGGSRSTGWWAEYTREEDGHIIWRKDGDLPKPIDYTLFDVESPLLRQALDTHPQVVHHSDNLYECHFRTEETMVRILLQFDGDRLVRVLKPLGKYGRYNVRPDVRVVGSKRVATIHSGYGKGITGPTLTLSDHIGTWEVSPWLGGIIVDRSIRLRGEPSMDDMGVTFHTTGDVDNGFQIGQMNDMGTIAGITHINGTHIPKLEKQLWRVPAPDPEYFRSGGIVENAYLPDGMRLQLRMMQDTLTVESRHMTHELVARVLKYITQFHARQLIQTEGIIQLLGQSFMVRFTTGPGWISLFEKRDLGYPQEDYQVSSLYVELTNLNNGQTFNFSGTTAETAARYGIYLHIDPRTGTAKHIDPGVIIDGLQLDRMLLPDGISNPS